MHQITTSKINIAIVLGSKSVNAVGLIRSLGQAGIPVTFASNYTKLESKWTRDYLRLPDDKSEWLTPLLTYINSCSYKPVIFPTDDDTAFFLDAHYDQLKEKCFFSHAKGQLQKIADKATMSEMAADCGLSVPAFQKLSLLDCSTQITEFPVILKPYAAYAGSKGDIRICRNPAELEESIVLLNNKGYDTIIAQDFVQQEGQYEIGLMGVSLPDGTVILPATIYKIRSYPPERGSTSYAKIKKGIDTAEETAICRFLQASGYVGLFDIEMIIAGGMAYFIEINYRNGQYGYAPTAAGYNLPANWYHGILGDTTAPVGEIKEIFYMNERDDRLHVRDGRLSKKKWKAEFRSAAAYGMYCPGDQRPYVRQYLKIPDRIMIKLRKLKATIKDLLIKEEWCVAYRICGENRLYQDDKYQNTFIPLKNSFRYWAADPFVITVNNVQYIFFEMFDRFVGKGYIGYRTVQDGKVSKMRKVYECDTHLSFPYLFCHKGNIYMMPESAKSRELYVLKAVSFPEKWERVHTFASDKKACDSVFLKDGQDTYLLTQEIGDHYDFGILTSYQIDNVHLASEAVSLISGCPSNARMAGAIIYDNERMIRVAQDCSTEYGGGICFNEILSLPKSGYSERIIKRITIDDIPCTKRGRFRGIHTYNADDSTEVIDLKHQYRFHFGNLVNVFYRIIRKIFPK